MSIKQHSTAVMSAVAIVTAVTGMVLNHFWPEGVAVAKKSHEAIAPLVNAASEDVSDLQDAVAVERTKRRELARRVHQLEERMMSREVAAASRAHAVVPAPLPAAAEGAEEGPADAADALPEADVPSPAPVEVNRRVRQVPTFDSLDE